LPGVPAGARAIQLWDSRVRHDFLKLFGRSMQFVTLEDEEGLIEVSLFPESCPRLP
jgi:hypothetical protein